MIESYLDKNLEESPLPKDIKSEIIYWFRKDNYLLVKSENNFSSDISNSTTEVIYNPKINQKIDDDKFIWNNTKK